MDRELRISMSGKDTAKSLGLPHSIADLSQTSEQLKWATHVGVATTENKENVNDDTSNTSKPSTKRTFKVKVPTRVAPAEVRSAVRHLVSYGMLGVTSILDEKCVDNLFEEIKKQEREMMVAQKTSEQKALEIQELPHELNVVDVTDEELPCGDIHDGSYSSSSTSNTHSNAFDVSKSNDKTIPNNSYSSVRRLDLKLDLGEKPPQLQQSWSGTGSDEKLSNPIQTALSNIFQTLGPVFLLWADGGLFSPAPLCELAAMIVSGQAPGQVLHSDSSWFHGKSALTCFVALHDVVLENGATIMFPFTHHVPEAHREEERGKIREFGDKELMNHMNHQKLGQGGVEKVDKEGEDVETESATSASTSTTLNAESDDVGKNPIDYTRPIPCLLKKGDCVIMDSRLLHYGGENCLMKKRSLFYFTMHLAGGEAPVGSTLTLKRKYGGNLWVECGVDGG